MAKDAHLRIAHEDIHNPQYDPGQFSPVRRVKMIPKGVVFGWGHADKFGTPVLNLMEGSIPNRSGIVAFFYDANDFAANIERLSSPRVPSTWDEMKFLFDGDEGMADRLLRHLLETRRISRDEVLAFLASDAKPTE